MVAGGVGNRKGNGVGKAIYRTRPWAFWLGLKDGWASPSCLSMGLTWGDSRDEVYDSGVTFGQRVGARVKRLPLDPVARRAPRG